jgi:RNA polymerase sigma factor for flagellar operon FliA
MKEKLSEESINTLWTEFARTRSVELRQNLVDVYEGMVKFIAAKYIRNAKTSSESLEEGDIIQFGMLGLLDAIEKFDLTRGVKFETYAVARITGAIQDELRKLDWIPRSLRQKAREAEKVVAQNEALLAEGKLSEKEIDEHQKAIQTLQDLTHQTQAGAVDRASPKDTDESTVEQLPADEQETNPLVQMTEKESKEILVAAITALAERDRLVITLYYYEELTFKEIAHVLKISESRVFQIHTSVMKKLRLRLAVLG